MKVNINTKWLTVLVTVFWVGFIFAGTGSTGFAQERFRMEKEDFERFKPAKRMFQKGKQLFLDGKTDRAVKAFTDCLERFPRYSEADYYLARIYYDKGLYDKASAHIEKARANAAYMSNLLVSAQLEYFKLLRKEKEELERQRRNASSPRVIERLNKEIMAVDSRLREPLPSTANLSAAYYYVHGNILSKLERYGAARDKYLEAVRLNPTSGNALLNLAATYFMLKDYTNALACLNRAETEVGQTHPDLKDAVLKAMKAPETGDKAVIVLKSGEKINGSIQTDAGGKLVVKGNIEIDKSNIASINRPEAAPRSEAATAPPAKKKTGVSVPAAVEPADTASTESSLFVRLFGTFNRGRSFSVKINYNYLQPKDVEFRDAYGNWSGFPELRIGYRLTTKVAFWLRYGEITGEVYLPIVEENAESSQTYVSFGLGFRGRLKGKVSYMLDLGLLNSRYLERAMGEEVEDSALGFRVDGGFRYDFSKWFFADLTLSYLSANSSVLDNDSIGIGGMGGGFGLGVKF